MCTDWQSYSSSEMFDRGLEVTKAIWSKDDIFPLSGLYIHLNLFPIPTLMEVISTNSTRFNTPKNIVKTLNNTSQFLHAIIGRPKQDSLQGGIKNQLVIDWLCERDLFHHGLNDLQPWMMDYVAKIITESPLQLLQPNTFSKEDVSFYYEYMEHAWKIMNVRLYSPVKTSEMVVVEETATFSPFLRERVSMLKTSYEMLYGLDISNQMFERVERVLAPSIIQAIKGHK